MELEAVGRVSVGDLGLEIGWQIDDADGVKGAFLRADTLSACQHCSSRSTAHRTYRIQYTGAQK